MPGQPFLLGNAWDSASARAAASAGLPAIGTSSAAISDMLGVPDGSGLTFESMRPMIAAVIRAVDVPVSIDLEAGYSKDPTTIAEHVLILNSMGAVGINIEDSVVDPVRRLLPAEVFACMLEKIRNRLDRENCPMFINARTDPFVVNIPEALDEAVRRAKAYEAAGADGIFAPGICRPSDIETLIGATRKPVNVMAVPTLPDLDTLARLGVARVSMGNSLHHLLSRISREALERVRISGRFDHVF